MRHALLNDPPPPHHLLLGLLLVLGMLCLALCVMLPSLANGKPAKRTECAANLRSIAQACLIYAERNGGQFPPRLSMLTAGGDRAFLRAEQLECPVSGGPYFYISGQTDKGDPRNVVIYEPTHYHMGEGGNLAYADGHAQWRNTVGHSEELRITRERLDELRLCWKARAGAGQERMFVATRPATATPPSTQPMP